MEDTLDEILEDCDTEGAEPLTRTFKWLQAKMNTIFDELRGVLEDLEDDDVEIEDYDWESLYERSQSAVKTVRKKLSIVINENVNPGSVKPTSFFGEKVSGENHFLKGSFLTD